MQIITMFMARGLLLDATHYRVIKGFRVHKALSVYLACAGLFSGTADSPPIWIAPGLEQSGK